MRAAALLVLAACGGHGPAPAPVAPTTCTAAVHRAFDFWLGTWTVRTPDGKIAGHNTITSIHGGCALHEDWHSARGSTGSSLNFVDPATGEWVQQWVDSDGDDIRLRGGLVDGAMVLDGTLVSGEGKASRLRGTWTPLPDGTVRQLFEESTDDGGSWSTWFDGSYQR